MEDKSNIVRLKLEKNDTNADVVEEKSVKPHKSSSEIVAELFKVFNAEPPKELLQDDLGQKKVKEKKHKKKHKKDKHSDNIDSPNNKQTSDGKIRKRKSRDQICDNIERQIKVELDQELGLKSVILKPITIEKTEIKFNYTNGEYNNNHKKSDKVDVEHDEHVYVKKEKLDNDLNIKNKDEHDKYLNDKRSPKLKKSHSKHKRKSRSRSRSRERSRRDSRSHIKRSPHHHTRHRGRSRSRHRSRSRSRRASRRASDLGIDKEHLLEVARKNALNMFHRGALPYNDKTVYNLTEFCSKLANGANLSDIDKTNKLEINKPIHHPFAIKPRDPIVIHFNKPKPIEKPAQDNQCKVISLQFPVSSGQEHRLSEAILPTISPPPPLTAIPVPTSIPAPTATIPTPTPVPTPTAVEATTNVNAENGELATTTEPIENNNTPATTEQTANVTESKQPETCMPAWLAAAKKLQSQCHSTTRIEQVISELAATGPPPPPQTQPTNYSIIQGQPIATVQQPAVANLVNPSAPTLDVSTIVANRLSAMRNMQNVCLVF